MVVKPAKQLSGNFITWDKKLWLQKAKAKTNL
jgi:hypothetical protein